jgi:hypothetical protein
MKKQIWFGYKVNNPEKPLASMLEVFKQLQKPPLCMLQNVDFDLLSDFQVDPPPYDFSLGQWILSTGSCQTGIHIAPPFDKIDDAFEAARIALGVNKFLEQPEFNNFQI